MKNLLFLLLLIPFLSFGQMVSLTDAATGGTRLINIGDIRYANTEGNTTVLLRGNNLERIIVTNSLASIVAASNGTLYKFTNNANGRAWAVGKAHVREVTQTASNKAVITLTGISGGFTTQDSFPDVSVGIRNKSTTAADFASLQLVVSDPDTLTADTLNFGSNSRVEDYATSVSNGNWTLSVANGTIEYDGIDSVLVEISYSYSVTHSAATASVTGVVYAGSSLLNEASRIVQGTATGVREIVTNTFTTWIQPNTAISARLSGAAGTIIAYSGNLNVKRL